MEHALTTWTYLFIYSSDQYSFDLPQSEMQIPLHIAMLKIHFQTCAGILNYGIFNFGNSTVEQINFTEKQINSTEEQINFAVQKYVQV